MLLKLYWLGAAVALMPLSIQPDPLYPQRFFSGIPKTIINTTFPFDLNTETTFDIVLVKCPFGEYKHNDENDIFKSESKIETSHIKELLYQDRTLIWTPTLRKSSSKVQLNCGKLIKDFVGSNDKYRFWTYNVMWKKTSTLPKSAEHKHTRHDLEEKHIKCNNGIDDALILTKNKENDIIVKVDPTNLKNPYVNQMFHYFNMPGENDTNLIQEPCATVKIYFNCPKITLKEYTSVIQKNINGTSFNVINTSGNQEIINVILDVGGDRSFYRGEKVLLKRMRYLKEETKVIEDSKISITSNFTIKGFDLVELAYNCPDKNNFKLKTQKYYFAPSIKDLKLEKKTISYSVNENLIKPNCPTAYLAIGYLEEVIYNEIRGNVSTLSSIDGIKDKFQKVGSNIIFDETENGTTTISCIYKTLDGHITTTTDFVNSDKVTERENYLKEKHLNDTIEYNKTLVLQQIALDEKNKKVKSINETLRETQKVMDQKIKETNKSFFQKFSDKVGERNAYVLTAGFILLILVILAVIFVILYKKWLGPFLVMLKYKKKYPNVYVFWDNLTSESFDTYCKTIRDKKYLSDKVLNRKVVKKMEGGEEVDIGISDLFDGTLVNCYKNMPMKIKAHYMYTDTENRKYILSDGITVDTQPSFWQMIYEEDIGTIVAIIYNKKTEDNDDASEDLYWKKDKAAFNDIVVTCSNTIKVNVLSVTGYKILLEKKGGPSKELELYHVSNWKENDIPQTDLQFVNVYQEIFKKAPKKNILIHSSQGTGARVYMLTYFACIYDALKSDKDIDCPFKVIKMMREQRYGGNLVPYEFAYLIKALVSTFFRNGILVDFSHRPFEFNISYDDFFYSYLKRKDKMDAELRKFLDFVNIVDKEKIYEYRSVFYMLGRMDSKTLLNYTKRFQSAVKNNIAGIDKRRFRYGDIPCLDAHGITVNGKPEADKDSFIHANKFEYTTVDKKTRKMILCQAPLDETVDDMLDMILRYKVTVVVVLVKPEEASDSQRKWVPYFPTQTHTLETANFSVLRMKIKELDKHFISETEYQLRSKKGLPEMNFTILHYQGWPDKSIPSEHMSIYALYKRVISLRTDDYVAIHCSAGIGRTGTLALIMYLIDTINYFPTFDPVERLKCLREHRYLAVQKYPQFVFALTVVFEHYKKQIDDMDADAYDKFLEVAENLYKKEKEIEDKVKKAMEEKRKKRDENKRKK
uniref:Tyrosine-protein phosphatase domain-containing protein n=1 Tax=Strongyloides papillosus TaxID=174720 RepID=A0A0N5B4E3_STREA